MSEPTAEMKPPPRLLIVLIANLLLLGIVSVVVTLALSSSRGTTPSAVDELFAPKPGFEGFRIPEFSLVDQDGAPANASLLDGHYTVLTFVFTNCVLVCPQLTGETAALHAAMEGTPTRFLSISVDPQRDSPQVLTEYAARYNADPERWRFLTGDAEEVHRLAMEGLSFDISPDTNAANIITLADGSTMNNISHPSAMVLIGPDRQVLGRYLYTIPGEIDELQQRLRGIFAVEESRRD
ncbi:MAG: SCO family protein [Planctomycetota bacterium]